MLDRISKVLTARLHDDSGGELSNDEEGFTLVELLIVVVVLGILAAVTVFGLSGTTTTSYKSACNADARSTEIAIESYHTNNDPLWPANMNILLKDANGVVYLRTLPNSQKYQISTDGAGAVLVSGPAGANPAPSNYDNGVNGVGGAVNPCTLIP